MTEKRFTIKPQDDYFGVTDNYSPDKVCVVNGIRIEIEAKWLCDLMNELNDENVHLKKENRKLKEFLKEAKEHIHGMLSKIAHTRWEIEKASETMKKESDDLDKNIDKFIRYIIDWDKF